MVVLRQWIRVYLPDWRWMTSVSSILLLLPVWSAHVVWSDQVLVVEAGQFSKGTLLSLSRLGQRESEASGASGRTRLGVAPFSIGKLGERMV